jgi:glycosyltransferase involved in cell wall biosynthesis
MEISGCANPNDGGSEVQPPALRIGLISPFMFMGGVERWWLSLCRQWAGSRTIMPSGIALTGAHPLVDPSSICEALRAAPVWTEKSARIPGATAVGSDVETVRTLAAVSDILITWGRPDLGKFSEHLKCSVVFCAHGTGWWTAGIVAGAAQHITHFVAVSEAARAALPEAIREQTIVLLNGIDLDRAAPSRSRTEVREELKLLDSQLAIGYVGRCSWEKNPFAAAHAAALIPNAVAVYCGPQWLRQENQETARALAGDRCRFVAPRHVGDVYAALDVLMAASKEEGCCLTVMEAWAAGLPVVSTPAGAVPELEERYGQLVRRVPFNPSPTELVEAVQRSPALPQTELARRTAWSEFGAAGMARRWELYLQSITTEVRK